MSDDALQRDMAALVRTKQLLRFVIVGGGATLLYFALVMTLSAAGGPLAGCSFIAYVVSCACSFVGHRVFTFASRGALLGEAARFVALNLVGLAAALAAPMVLVNRFGLAPIFAAFSTCAIAPAANYLAMRSLVFYRARRVARAEP